MKARAEANSEPIYNNDSFDNYTSSTTKFPLNLESNNKEQSENVDKKYNCFLSNGVTSRKLSPTQCNYTILPNDFSPEKELQPLHFNTNEVLEETPPILKSLSSGGRGPDTFVYLSSSKPTSLSRNEDPCRTFVISSESSAFVNRKNSLNQVLAVNGVEKQGTEGSEYLSYVIEKTNGSDTQKMNEGDNEEENSAARGVDEVDRAIESKADKSKGEIDSKEEFFVESKGDNCDIVECKGDKSVEDAAVLSFDRTITGKKEQTFAKLQDELQKAHQELKLKDEEVTRLTRIREDVERELEELTASLFQEAHKMVSKAKEKQAAAEKNLKESQMKVEVLTAEVVALKTLVLTSTPSRPNPHLHPQIGKEENGGGVNLFTRKHRRSPSHFNLKYGRENSPPESPVRDEHTVVQNTVDSSFAGRDVSEVDPTVHKEFLNWTLNYKLDKTDPFIDRIYREDINLCLDFSNRELAEEVQKAIETRNIFIEAVTDKSKTIFPRKCALLEVTRQCHYRMKLGDQDVWYNISQMCRNRIIAVCDFINYLRYIELGLVKSSPHDIYWEIMRLRKEMVLARLGLSLPPS